MPKQDAVQHIPRHWRGVYADLQDYFNRCWCDEIERDWPSSYCAQVIEELGRAELEIKRLQEGKS